MKSFLHTKLLTPFQVLMIVVICAVVTVILLAAGW
jgi:NADH:ubiquinone oxidoreductase subunit 6 (subunit J)